MITETLTVSRGKTDSMSKRTNTPHSVQGVLAWGTGSRSTGRFNSDLGNKESSSMTAQLYVRRGSDVKARDRIIRSNGEKYSVVGHSLWDQRNPLTGHDMGWAVFQLESANE